MVNLTPFMTPSQSAEDAEAALIARGEKFNGLGQRLIVTPETAGTDKHKLRGYTRATTFIKALEDQTGLEKWRTRLTLEGAVDIGLETLVHDAQEKHMATGGPSDVDSAKEYRRDLGDIAEAAFRAAGGADAADYGTALHLLIEQYHDPSIDELNVDGAVLDADEEWPGIKLDFNAYVAAWTRFQDETGAKVVESELLVVNDDLKVAGRTDFVLLVKFPGDARARRVIADIKSGSIEGGLKLSQQMAMYAGSKYYDPATGIRSPLRVRQDIAIIIHVPRGEATAAFHLVKLAPGRNANRLCLKVRESRRKVPGIMEVMASS